ncbi:hypothetical protein SM007_34565 [Streptomyces avermitilis]|uniref:Putative SRPBCC family protein n=1 Tax=Streptomyces avermitilis TaxID=33903 RepID=A0A224AUA0_STRAX|nr:SRPBCC family protein [Streptomyces avermitilis]OOV21298.1 hypothetical protein SM007_34565 [Streptomyces avermitilis]BBA21066.1 putative SRPBCC family protein [Streptomyces avermitilis]GDY68160.1 hypothetical protein SAV14893_075530 [Streptomyces avermitilis]GDY71487.1 hypothetical protein SAV31267_009720 [Streptomyces avermitilis]
MRLADGPQVECEIEVAAPPERVWRLVSDISTSARYSPELQWVEWLDGAEGPAVGACFVGRNSNAGLGEWQSVSRIAEFVEPLSFRWEVVREDDRNGEALTVWTYTLAPAADGSSTRLRHGMRIGPARGPLQEFVASAPEREERIVGGRLAQLRAGIEATLAGVKAEAEA